MKKKKQKSSSSSSSSSKKTAGKKEEMNPFELRINRQRYSVLGRNLKTDKGKPGVSRNRAIKRRAELFHKSMMLTKKSNAFIDKRIGEYDNTLSKEDVIVERMAQARKKRYKKDIYNLNDEEPLTHYGQPITDIDEFDAPEHDSEEEEEEDDAQLNADFVDKAHFGGFLSKKENTESPKSHKEVLGELILESKKRKEEKKVEREMNEDLTEKLDKEWKGIHAAMPELKMKSSETAREQDPYDLAVRELKFEPRGTPANLIKTEEEIKRAEQLRIKKLEEERMARMSGDDAAKTRNEELSADSIYDGLDIGNDVLEESAATGEQDEVDGNDEQEEESDEGDSEDEQSVTMERDSDIANFSSDSEEQPDCKSSSVSEPAGEILDSEVSSGIPQTLEQLLDLVSKKSKQEVSSLVGGIVKDYHPSRKAENKRKLEIFFSVLLKYVVRLCRDRCLDLVDALVPHMYSVTQISGVRTGLIFRKFLEKKISDYQKTKESHIVFPSLDILITLKLVSIFYPTSDFRHPIATPAFLLMADILSAPFKVTLQNILIRLFVACLIYEYVAFSKRLAVEPIHFLENVLYMASENPSFCQDPGKMLSRKKGFLLVNSPGEVELSKIDLRLLHSSTKLENPAAVKLCVVHCAVSQLQKFSELYSELPSFQELFSRTEMLCGSLPLKFYPPKLLLSIENLKTFLCENKRPRAFLTFPKRKPQMLKMLEPRFEMDSNERNMTLSKKIRLEKKISQKIKKEEKSIMREVRRDAQFLARKQIEERVKADEERKQKVKQICHDLSVQQAEYKKFAKKK